MYTDRAVDRVEEREVERETEEARRHGIGSDVHHSRRWTQLRHGVRGQCYNGDGDHEWLVD